MKRSLPLWAVPTISLLWFLLAGLLLIPCPGLQNDELFFSGPLYFADAAFYSMQTGASKIPLMVMSYTGALKTWLYAALFEFLEPNRWSVRVPVILMGMGTIWMTWLWVRRIAGVRAAAVATILLATDTIFLMTNTFDWGPVALQHVLLMGGLLAIQIWLATDSRRMLALGFFLWGLGLWDKALLSWPLIGLAVASLCVFPKQTLRRVRPLTLGIALGAFLLGALPLVWYNIQRPGETATANAQFTTAGLADKAMALRQTIDGSTLFGYMVYKNPAPNPRAPRTGLERLSVGIASIAGDHRRNWMLPAWILSLLCMAGLWRSTAWRALVFLLLVCLIEWVQMVFNKGTGGASHHVILMWPFPVVFVGVAFSAASRLLPRFGLPVLAGLTAVLALGNVLTTNEYFSEFTVNGGAGGWTDAIYPLANSVEKNSASWIGLVDWGYLNQLRMLHEGDLPLFLPPIPPAGAQPSEAERAELKEAISDSTRLFIQHTDDKQMFPG
ncbi:MAG: glycosyltransferase family 39 protein, partial [Acidobacteriota bacterium]|nr:glycosyltransferase family 39 protein [Acidobacteriota bacterium]